VANQVRCDRRIASLCLFRLSNNGRAGDVDCHRSANFDSSRFHIHILHLQWDNFARAEPRKSQ